jgi:crossover junction endodeoxyribonuclease RuvC
LKILGIDPGTNNLGYGIIESKNSRLKIIEAGVIKFKEKDLQLSIKDLHLNLNQLIENIDIDEVAMETLFFAKNPQSILKLGQFRGAILSELLKKFNQVSEYSPLQIKEAVTGNGKSTKDQVNFMVKRLLNVKVEIKPFDISDALAVAITHSQRV